MQMNYWKTTTNKFGILKNLSYLRTLNKQTMGQYYQPTVLHTVTKKNGQIALRPRAAVNSHSVGCSSKLMEHSYIGNHLCVAIENLLRPDGDWYMQPIVWAGDYADKEVDTQYNWMDQWGTIREGGENLYSLAKPENYIVPKPRKLPAEFQYILNHDTKQFVDKKTVPKDADGYRLNPLPLLTCEGNGRGGGDYCDEDKAPAIIGSWARCRISVETSVPADFTELIFNLIENK